MQKEESREDGRKQVFALGGPEVEGGKKSSHLSSQLSENKGGQLSSIELRCSR